MKQRRQHHRFVPALAATLAAVAMLCAPLSATTVRKVSFSRICTSADAVFCGTVESVESRRDPQTGNIYTDTTFRVDHWIAGAPIEDRYTLRMSGGTADGESIVIHGLPRFGAGRRYVLFVRGNGRLVCPVVGWRQGCFHVIDDADSHPHVRTFDDRAVSAVEKGRLVTAARDRSDRPRPTVSGQPPVAEPRTAESPPVLSLDQFIDAIRAERARPADQSGSATP